MLHNRWNRLLGFILVAGEILIVTGAAMDGKPVHPIGRPDGKGALFTVDVIAVDDDGTPVRSLTQEDFQLFENGKRQELYGVEEVRAEAGATAAGAGLLDENASSRGKTVMILFDDASIEPRYARAARESAAGFVRAHMGPQDTFAVASFGMSMRILQNFTQDGGAVLRAMEESGSANAGNGDDLFENLLRSLNEIGVSMARLRGRKSLFIYTQPRTSTPDTVMGGPMGFGRRMGPPNNPRDGLSRSASFGSGTTNVSYQRALESVRMAEVVVYTIDPGTLTGQDAGTALTLRSLAEESGGFAIKDADGRESGLDILARQLSNYYILSYASRSGKAARGLKKIEVRTKRKGVALKYREVMPDKGPSRILESDENENSLLDALASGEGADTLSIAFRPLYFYDSARFARVHILAGISSENIVAKKKGTPPGADIHIMGVAWGEDGSTAARFSESLPIRVDRNASGRENVFTYRNYFILRPGKYRLKMAVSDQAGNVGTSEQVLEIPDFPENGIRGSSLIVAERASRLPDLVHSLQSQLLDAEDPLVYSGIQMEPGVENIVKNDQIPVVFRLYNLPKLAGSWKLSAHARLMDENGTEYGSTPIIFQNSDVSQNESVVVIGIPLSFPEAPPGRYRLVLDVVEEVSGRSTVLQTQIKIAGASQARRISGAGTNPAHAP
jgi:VWFA-related protein